MTTWRRVPAPGLAPMGRRAALRRQLRRQWRRAGLRFMRHTTGGLRSELKQLERKAYLAPF
ncbi:hypothetical protein GCM10007242_47870 [Pigmentiphaga litoralis]|nr:hypothetical protein GCM10007242_47870 [Pigmentiphaga litoralis]